MPVRVRYLTDPACSWSWAAEPAMRRLEVEFDGSLRWTYVMGGLAREYAPEHRADLLAHWLDVADESRMPVDARLWSDEGIASTYPACMAVKAAAEQADDGGAAFLRAVREGLLCFRRKLDTTEALVEEARRVGLDTARFRSALDSSAIVEAFGADIEEVREVPAEADDQEGATKGRMGERRVSFPSVVFTGEDGERHGVYGRAPLERYREAALAAGAIRSGAPSPDVLGAVGRFGRLATAEVEAVCDLPEPRAAAELWRLASEGRLRPVRVLTGWLWEVV